jgi:hypothetical protein
MQNAARKRFPGFLERFLEKSKCCIHNLIFAIGADLLLLKEPNSEQRPAGCGWREKGQTVKSSFRENNHAAVHDYDFQFYKLS